MLTVCAFEIIKNAYKYHEFIQFKNMIILDFVFFKIFFKKKLTN